MNGTIVSGTFIYIGVGILATIVCLYVPAAKADSG